jgi:3-oxoacyl-[acyl-carrier protein] reductase
MLVIMGSTGGLGAGLCEYFGARAEARTAFGPLLPTTRKVLDLEDEHSVARFFRDVQRTLAARDPLYVINATGCSINGMIHKTTSDEWLTTMQVNLNGNFLVLKYLRPIVENGRESAVVILGSVVSELGVVGATAYAASKSGLHGMVRGAAKEFARFGTRINCIQLGYFDRGLVRQIPPAMLEEIREAIPLKRLGTIEDLAQACDFALRCKYLTGTVLKLNGGLH